jgi:cyclohexanone monooxygenase
MAVADGDSARDYDAIVVGAGFAGLYMLHRLRALGLTARVFEAGSGVGGTWYWNRYPGARVDIRSMEYSYSFSPELEREWRWTERYASQPELLRYLEHVAERFDLKRDISFDTRVTAATFDEAANNWVVTTDGGERLTARFCIMATGCLSKPKDLDLEGVGRFAGAIYNTSNWPLRRVDFRGQRVAVIGTGSSGIQSIPVIAAEAAHVHVFQRTANFSIPAQNEPVSPELLADWDANRDAYRAQARGEAFGIILNGSEQLALDATPNERQDSYETCWQRGGFDILGAYADLVFDVDANATAAAFVTDKIRATVSDPQVAEKLVPKTHPIGTKRMCIDTGYYATYNRDNVTLVDIRATPIESFTETGIKTSDAEYAFDAIVLATGFDAMTGALTAIDIRGRGGASLKDKWAQGPRTYLGLMVAGFPNLLTIAGPGSPSVLANMVMAIEQHVGWIADCLAHMGERQIATIEASKAAEDEWVAHVNEVADTTLFPLANSWYVGANVPGKPRVFMPYVGGFPTYQEKIDEVSARGYEGFELQSLAAAD